VHQDGGLKILFILPSIDRYGAVMLAEYTAVAGKKILAQRMKTGLYEPPIRIAGPPAVGTWNW